MAWLHFFLHFFGVLILQMMQVNPFDQYEQGNKINVLWIPQSFPHNPQKLSCLSQYLILIVNLKQLLKYLNSGKKISYSVEQRLCFVVLRHASRL